MVGGRTALRFDANGKVAAVADDWDTEPFDIVKKQAAPRVWDVYDLWATPPAERPCDVELDTFKAGKAPARLVRTHPRLVLRATLDDVSNSRKRRSARYPTR